MPFSAADHAHMAEALRLAARGLYSTHPNPRVGCVVVRGDDVVGRGFHVRAGEPHAEVHALREAGAAARGATVYVTLEPCAHHGRTPPCADALVQAGVARVVVACLDANPLVAGQGVARLQAAGITVDAGLMQAEAEALNAGFLRRMAGGLPWLRVKVASSLDGRTAMASGESQWITGPAARRDVQRWRARSSALISGIGTVLADDPGLIVRPADWQDAHELLPDRQDDPARWTPADVHQPLRVILDTELRLPLTARLMQLPGDTLVVTCGELTGCDGELPDALEPVDPVRAGRARGLLAAGAQLLAVPADASGRPDPRALLQELAARGHAEVLLESGPTLVGAFLQAGVVDEVVLYQAPVLLGSEARPLAVLPVQRMADRVSFRVVDQRLVGSDVRWLLRPQPASPGDGNVHGNH